MDIEKALRQYQKIKDFSDDYQRKKTELFADFHVLPDDLTIERMVLEEEKKRIEGKEGIRMKKAILCLIAAALSQRWQAIPLRIIQYLPQRNIQA